MGYIPKHALQNLDKYKYSGVDKSILSKYILNPYWNQLVKLWPKSVAPNTITLTGLSLVFMNFLTMLYYDPNFYTAKHGVQMPQWIYFTWSAGLFMYQSLDAIDGKQARRTQMAGPLGEMFDHGCDAINTTLEAILTCYALNLGRSWWTVASLVFALANFYLTTWEEYHTGQLFLGVFSGPVEGILMIVALYALTGIVGPTYWDQNVLTVLHLEGPKDTIPLPDMPINIAFMYFGFLGLLFNILASISNVRASTFPSPPPSPPDTPSTSTSAPDAQEIHTLSHPSPSIKRIKPFLRILPFPLAVSIQLAWLASPTPQTSTILHSSLFVPFLCAWGLQFAHQVGRMILAHLTRRQDMPFWEWLWVPTTLAALDANAWTLLGRKPYFLHSYANIQTAVYVSLFLSFATYARFCYVVIQDITNYLGIACFTVRKKGKDGVWRSSVPDDSEAKRK